MPTLRPSCLNAQATTLNTRVRTPARTPPLTPVVVLPSQVNLRLVLADLRLLSEHGHAARVVYGGFEWFCYRRLASLHTPFSQVSPTWRPPLTPRVVMAACGLMRRVIWL